MKIPRSSQIPSNPRLSFLMDLRLVAFLVLTTFSLPSQAINIDELVRHVDQLWRGTTSQASLTMTVKTRHYQRTLTMESWSRGNEDSLVVIRKPIKDKGIATLKVGQNIWNYLPKINRVTKIPASMMAGSWMGSHFTNDDLVKESTYEASYDSTISFEGKRNGHLIYEITSIPKPNAAVVWGKVVMTIEQSSLVPIQADYYDEAGKLIRTLTFDEIRQINGRSLPMRMTLQPIDKPNESTVMVYDHIDFGVKLPDNFFSLQTLKQRR